MTDRKPIDKMTLAEINAELVFINGDEAKQFKRIDHARGALIKLRAASKKKTAPRAKKTKEPVQYDFAKSDYNGRRAFTSRGPVIIKGWDEKHKMWLVKDERSGKERPASERAVRFKAVDDSYREQYVHDNSVHTESGAPSIHCGDALAEAMAGLTHKECELVARENDLLTRWNKWDVNKGMARMNLGNVLRARLRRGEKVLLKGKTFKDKDIEPSKVLRTKAATAQQAAA